MNYKVSFQQLDDESKVVISGQPEVALKQVHKEMSDHKESVHSAEIKSRPNHKIYLQILDKMGPEQRLAKVFELSSISRNLFKEGLKMSFPEKSEDEINCLYLKRIAKCYNRNY